MKDVLRDNTTLEGDFVIAGVKDGKEYLHYSVPEREFQGGVSFQMEEFMRL